MQNSADFWCACGKGKGILEPLSRGEQDKAEMQVKVFERAVLTQECSAEQ